MNTPMEMCARDGDKSINKERDRRSCDGINSLIVTCTGDVNSRRNASNFCLRVVVRTRGAMTLQNTTCAVARVPLRDGNNT